MPDVNANSAAWKLLLGTVLSGAEKTTLLNALGAATSSQGATADSALQAGDVVDDLTTGGSDVPVSAAQAVVLKGLIDNINTLLSSDESTLDDLQEVVDFIQLNRSDLDALGISGITGLQAALDGKAPTTVISSYTTPAEPASNAAHAFDCTGKSALHLLNNATNTTITISNIAKGQRVTVSGNNTITGYTVTIAHATYPIYGDQTVIGNEATNTEWSVDIERVGDKLHVSQNTFSDPA